MKLLSVFIHHAYFCHFFFCSAYFFTTYLPLISVKWTQLFVCIHCQRRSPAERFLFNTTFINFPLSWTCTMQLKWTHACTLNAHATSGHYWKKKEQHSQLCCEQQFGTCVGSGSRRYACDQSDPHSGHVIYTYIYQFSYGIRRQTLNYGQWTKLCTSFLYGIHRRLFQWLLSFITTIIVQYIIFIFYYHSQ